jgi:hypothetical protein
MKGSAILVVVGFISVTSGAHAEARDSGEKARSSEADEGPGGTRLAFDLDYANGLEPNVDGGLGGALRFGHEYDLVLLSLTPEFMANLDDLSGAESPLVYGGLAGGRLTIGKIIEPGVFAHVGAGNVNLPGDDLTGLALDLGVSVDLTLVPAVDLGVHAAYDAVTWGGEGTFDWYRVGAHLAIAP